MMTVSQDAQNRLFCGPRLRSALIALILGWAALPLQAATKAGHITGEVDAFTVVSGLQAPDGMDLHPESGEIYVAEKGAGRISKIKDGRRSTVIEAGSFTVNEAIESWAISKERTRAFILESKLVDPAGVAFGPGNHLFVAEQRPHGRLLEFIPDEKGRYTTARYIPIPWLDKRFAWDDLQVTSDGRVFVVGYDPQGEGLLHFGSVLMRAKDGDWWVIDYGPFSKFASINLSRGEDIIVVGERMKGEIVSWDTFRQMPIGSIASTVFKEEAETTGLLKDGTYVVGAVPADPNGPRGKSRLIRVDQMTEQATEIAAGFDRVSSMVLNEETGYLYVSDSLAGTVTELRPRELLYGDGYILQRSREAFESSAGFSPRVAPAFLKGFLSSVGAEPRDDTPAAADKGKPKQNVAYGHSFTLREFASKIPMVAGKVNCQPTDGEGKVEDPVLSVEFLLLFPAHAVKATDSATPSLSFFNAKRLSGRKETSRVLFEGLVSSQRVGDEWIRQSDNARIYVPLATCGLTKREGGMDLSLSFLGMGVYDDYYLQLTTGKENKGKLLVEGKWGGRSEYFLSFMEKPVVGGEPVKNLVVAGFDPATKSQDLGWLKIGRWPVEAALHLEEKPLTKFAAMDSEITEIIKQKELERRMAVEEAGGAEDEIAPPAEEPAEEAVEEAPEPAEPEG